MEKRIKRSLVSKRGQHQSTSKLPSSEIQREWKLCNTVFGSMRKRCMTIIVMHVTFYFLLILFASRGCIGNRLATSYFMGILLFWYLFCCSCYWCYIRRWTTKKKEGEQKRAVLRAKNAWECQPWRRNFLLKSSNNW